MKTLTVGPWVGEFGWELMSWQAYARAKAQGFDRVVVCAPPSSALLYEDFSSEFVPCRLTGTPDCWRMVKTDPRALAALENELGKFGGERLRPTRRYKAEEQKFIRYGDAELGEEFDVVIHARGNLARTVGANRSWPVQNWDFTVGQMRKQGLKVAAIGLPDAYLPKGAEDRRGRELKEVTNLLSASKLLLGPSSGPMHLGALCGIPILVWTDKAHWGAIGGTNKARYEEIWNPFKTPCRVLERGWAVDPSVVVKEALAFLKGEQQTTSWTADERKHIFSKHLGFWRNRAQQSKAANLQQQDRIVSLMKSKLNGDRFDEALDFGCGDGRFIPWLTERCKHVWAADIVELQCERTAERAKTVTPVELNDEFKLPFKQPRIDFLFACFVFQHLTDDDMFNAAAESLRGCLKPGARVIVIDNAADREFHVRSRESTVLARALGLAEGWKAEKVTINDRPQDHWLIDGRKA